MAGEFRLSGRVRFVVGPFIRPECNGGRREISVARIEIPLITGWCSA